MLSLTFYKFFLIFIMFSVVGWITESLWCFAGTKKLVNRGFLTGPWCPIYGSGALLLLIIAEPFIKYPVLVFVISFISTTALEYFTGWLMETLFKAKWWDYSHRKFNVKGRICLRNSFFFGLGGLVIAYGAFPLALKILNLLNIPWQIGLTYVISALFIWDFMHAVAVASKLQDKLASIKENITELEVYLKENISFDKLDMSDRISQLKEMIGSREASDKKFSELIDKLSSQFSKNAATRRLIKAFPKLSTFSLPSELETFKSELINELKKRYKRIKTTKKEAASDSSQEEDDRVD